MKLVKENGKEGCEETSLALMGMGAGLMTLDLNPFTTFFIASGSNLLEAFTKLFNKAFFNFVNHFAVFGIAFVVYLFTVRIERYQIPSFSSNVWPGPS